MANARTRVPLVCVKVQVKTVFQCGMGVARSLKRCSTTGLKSFFISHSSIMGRQSFGLSAVVSLASLAPIANHPGVLKNTDVLGHCRLGHAGASAQGVYSVLAVAGG